MGASPGTSAWHARSVLGYPSENCQPLADVLHAIEVGIAWPVQSMVAPTTLVGKSHYEKRPIAAGALVLEAQAGALSALPQLVPEGAKTRIAPLRPPSRSG